MSHPLDREAINELARKEREREKWLREQLRADFKQVMNIEGMRRILYLFMQQMGVDSSPFATNAMAQSHAIGKQDAAGWWVDLMREFCPEKEAQVRREGLVWSKATPTTEEDDDAN